jgi:peptide deformylase
MAILNILHYPDPRLRIKALPVESVDDEIRRLAADMFETMYTAPGIGLAAPQVNVHKCMLVADVSETRDHPLCLINPEILSKAGTAQREEGCLSVPGVFDVVERAEWIRVRALNLEGETFELEADGLLAVCIQHEMDHLKGRLFVDYLSSIKRQRIRKKLEKAQR